METCCGCGWDCNAVTLASISDVGEPTNTDIMLASVIFPRSVSVSKRANPCAQEQDVGAAYESTWACRHTLIWVRRVRLGRFAGWEQALNILQPVYRLRCSNSSSSNVVFSARPSVAKALRRSWPCLGRHNPPENSCCSPPPASRAGTLCAECGSQLLSRSQIHHLSSASCHGALFSLC